MNLRSRGWRLNLSLPLLLVAVAVVGVGFVLGEEVGIIQSVVVQPGREDGVVGRPWWKWSKWSWGLLGEEAGGCEEHYGIMPCSTSLGGNAALLVIYGYCLLNAAQLLSAGSELLLTVMSPGLIGGLVLPILGAFPDALLITGASNAGPSLSLLNPLTSPDPLKKLVEGLPQVSLLVALPGCPHVLPTSLSFVLESTSFWRHSRFSSRAFLTETSAILIVGWGLWG